MFVLMFTFDKLYARIFAIIILRQLRQNPLKDALVNRFDLLGEFTIDEKLCYPFFVLLNCSNHVVRVATNFDSLASNAKSLFPNIEMKTRSLLQNCTFEVAQDNSIIIFR